MTTILNRPMATVNSEETFWVGLLRRSTGDAISDFTRADAAFFLYRVPFDDEDLSNMREVKVIVKVGAGPDLSDFNSSMVRRRMLYKIWLLPVLEQQGDIFENAALVSFDGEMIMGMTFRNQILSNLALGQQSIDRHILALNIDGVR